MVGKRVLPLLVALSWSGMSDLVLSQTPPTTAPAASAPATQPSEPVEKLAVRFIEALAAGDYVGALRYFHPELISQLPPEGIEKKWADLIRRYGRFLKPLAPSVKPYQEFLIVTVGCEFERSSANFQLVFDDAKRIVELAQNPVYREPAYVAPQTYLESDVLVGSGHWLLDGTLTLPTGPSPYPVVILVHDIGPFDRDSTLGPNKMFRDLALGLASRGIAVLRYEQRNYGEERIQKIAAISQVLTGVVTADWLIIEDVQEALTLLRSDGRFDPRAIFILGHGLGGLMAPRIATRDPAVAGLIIVNGMGRPPQDILLDRVKYYLGLDGQIDEKERMQIEDLEKKVARTKAPDLTASAPAEEMPLGRQPEFWMDLRDYRPAELAAHLNQPMLVLYGGRNYLVPAQDFEIWKKQLSDRKNVTFELYPTLNHLMMDGQERPDEDEYLRPNHVDIKVIEDIVHWVRQQMRSETRPAHE